MSRRRKHPEHANHERWLISYADFITLLFAFFVVMFASSEANKAKARKVSQSVEKAFGKSVASEHIETAPPPVPAPNPKFADLAPSLHLLEKELAAEISAGKIHLDLQTRGLVISLGEATFFSPGEDHVQADAFPSLAKVASALSALPNPIRLEGHSDSVPIHNSRFSSNWELSAARAVQILKALEERYGTSRFRLSAAGYADTVPVESNETDAGRARNRRVDLVVLSSSGVANDPSQPSPKTELFDAVPYDTASA